MKTKFFLPWQVVMIQCLQQINVLYIAENLFAKLIFMKNLLYLIVCLIVGATLNANETIQIDEKQYFIDQDKSMILTNLSVDVVNSIWPTNKTHIQLNELYAFMGTVASIEVGKMYEVKSTVTQKLYLLYFTELPIISISTDFTIVDEPDVLANFKMIESNQNYLESHVGIQYRGAYTQTLPKKSMEFEFWADETGDESVDHPLLDLVETDDWNLQAGYNEPLRIRSNNNWEIWRIIDGDLYYQEQEPKAVNGIRMRYIELFVNDQYRGVYSLGEKVKRKQLRLKKHNGEIQGELYKADAWSNATKFKGVTNFNNDSDEWAGWEYKHPKEEIDWSNLYDLIDFVANASNEDFYAQYDDRFHVDNLVSYYIFLNLIRATDNTGKNTYMTKYKKDEKYFYTPWDLDGTIGNIWDGSRENVYNDILTNGIYDRVQHDCTENGFWHQLKTKWATLRAGDLTHATLMGMFQDSHDVLFNNGVYSREEMAWSGFNYPMDELTYMSTWLQNRFNFLDEAFSKTCTPLSVNDWSVQSTAPKLYPNPTSDNIYFELTTTEEYTISVFNTAGQKVLKDKINGNKNGISLKQLGKGVYLVVLESSTQSHPHKVIVK